MMQPEEEDAIVWSLYCHYKHIVGNTLCDACDFVRKPDYYSGTLNLVSMKCVSRKCEHCKHQCNNLYEVTVPNCKCDSKTPMNICKHCLLKRMCATFQTRYDPSRILCFKCNQSGGSMIVKNANNNTEKVIPIEPSSASFEPSSTNFLKLPVRQGMKAMSIQIKFYDEDFED